jgi:hypothetical protein
MFLCVSKIYVSMCSKSVTPKMKHPDFNPKKSHLILIQMVAKKNGSDCLFGLSDQLGTILKLRIIS